MNNPMEDGQEIVREETREEILRKLESIPSDEEVTEHHRVSGGEYSELVSETIQANEEKRARLKEKLQKLKS